MTSESKSESKKYWPILVFVVVAMILWALIVNFLTTDYIAQFLTTDPEYTPEMYAAFSDVYYAASPLWAIPVVVTFIFCIKLFSLKTITGKIWLLLTIAMILWFIGDSYFGMEWFFHDHNETLESLHFGRICYIIGYVFILAGLAFQVKSGGLKLAKKEYGYIAIIEGIFIAVSLYACVIPLINLPVDGYYLASELDKGILVFYLIFDEVNIFLAIILIFKYRGGQFSKGWLILSIGFMVEAVYDMIYSFTSYILAQADPVFENAWYFFEPIYFIVYIILTVGALYLFIAVRSVHT